MYRKFDNFSLKEGTYTICLFIFIQRNPSHPTTFISQFFYKEDSIPQKGYNNQRCRIRDQAESGGLRDEVIGGCGHSCDVQIASVHVFFGGALARPSKGFNTTIKIEYI